MIVKDSETNSEHTPPDNQRKDEKGKKEVRTIRDDDVSSDTDSEYEADDDVPLAKLAGKTSKPAKQKGKTPAKKSEKKTTTAITPKKRMAESAKKGTPAETPKKRKAASAEEESTNKKMKVSVKQASNVDVVQKLKKKPPKKKQEPKVIVRKASKPDDFQEPNKKTPKKK